MKASLRKDNALVIYHGMRAHISLAGKLHVTIVFESEELDPVLLTNQQLEEEFGRSLLFVKDKLSTTKSYKNLTPTERVQSAKKNSYLNKLYELMGKKNGVGGLKVRMKAIEIVSKELDDFSPPSPSTIAEWARIERDEVGGVTGRVINSNKRKRASYYDQNIFEILLEIIDEHYLKPCPESFTQIYIRLSEEISRLELGKCPSYVTVKDRIKTLCPILVIKRTNSPKEAKKALRNATKKFSVKRPLERVETDGLYLQVGVVDDEGNYLGAVTIIFVIDVATRSILGYEMQIGKGEPSSTVIGAYKHAFCPKPVGSYSSRSDKTWYCYGCPELLVMDGGPGFSSTESHSYVLSHFGSIVETVSAYAGWLKPFIERFNGTFRSKCALKIPGYVGPMKEQKLLEHSIKQQAVLTIAELRKIIEIWIIDEYHHTPHSGINYRTPYQAWQDALDDGWVPEVPVDIERVMLPAGITLTRKISGDVCHLGVVIKNIRYNDVEARLKYIGLKLIQEGQEAYVTCRFNENDISAITVVDPFNDEDFIVHCTQEDIREKTTLAEFIAKRAIGKSPANKSSVVDKIPEVNKARKAHSVKTRSKPVKSRSAIPADYEEKIAEHQNASSKQLLPSKSPGIDDYDNPLTDANLDKIDTHDAS